MKILGQNTAPDIAPDVDARADATSFADTLRLQAGRGPDDDFYCLRFGVWYPSFDCAVRTRFQTCPGCSRCDQGRFNLRRHATGLARLRRVRHTS